MPWPWTVASGSVNSVTTATDNTLPHCAYTVHTPSHTHTHTHTHTRTHTHTHAHTRTHTHTHTHAHTRTHTHTHTHTHACTHTLCPNVLVYDARALAAGVGSTSCASLLLDKSVARKVAAFREAITS
jgi:hypothetical protein